MVAEFLEVDCGECRGEGHIQLPCNCEGFVYCDHQETCRACNGDGALWLYCARCGEIASHDCGTLGRFCETCAPEGCSVCAAFNRECCTEHRGGKEAA